MGTGGDNANTFNISTTSAMVIAAGGVRVAKHGNRAASSQCGTADCLEALGANIQEDPDLCRRLLSEVGFCFMFAQKYHSAMKYVGAIRRELGFRTVFNILGPLTNPAKPEYFLLGVYDEYLVEPVAKVPAENAQTTRDILSGKITDARRTSVLLNAGCGLYAGGAAASIGEGVKMAAGLIDSGKALAVLDAFIDAPPTGE